jgi:WD40 repeat protein
MPPSSSSDQRDDPASVELRGHSGAVTCLTVTPDEVLLVSGSVDGSCRVWHIASGQMLLSFEKHKGTSSAVLSH